MLTTAIDAMKAMIRDTHAFRAWADPDSPWDQATAAEHIHLDALPPPAANGEHSVEELTALRPFALLYVPDSSGFVMEADSSNGLPIGSGSIIARFEQSVPAELVDDNAALARQVATWFGQLLRTRNSEQPGLWDMNLQPGYLPLRRTTIHGPWRPERKDTTDLGDFVAIELEIDWGRR